MEKRCGTIASALSPVAGGTKERVGILLSFCVGSERVSFAQHDKNLR